MLPGSRFTHQARGQVKDRVDIFFFVEGTESLSVFRRHPGIRHRDVILDGGRHLLKRGGVYSHPMSRDRFQKIGEVLRSGGSFVTAPGYEEAQDLLERIELYEVRER